MKIFDIIATRFSNLSNVEKVYGIFNDIYIFKFTDDNLVVKVPKNTLNFEYSQFLEPNILKFLQDNNYEAPISVESEFDYKVRTYVEGITFSEYREEVSNTDEIIKKISKQIVNLHELDAQELIKESIHDHTNYLKTLISLEKGNYQFYKGIYKDIFSAFNIPNEPFKDVYESAKTLKSMFLVLGHLDLHPMNIIINKETDDVQFIDWETTIICNPFHDVASHIEKSNYSEREENLFVTNYIDLVDDTFDIDVANEQIRRFKNLEVVRQFINQLTRLCISTNNYEIEEKVKKQTIKDIYKKYLKACSVWGIEPSLTESKVMSMFEKHKSSNPKKRKSKAVLMEVVQK